MVGADIFMVNNITLLHTVDYYSKFPVVKRMDGLSADSLTAAVKVIFAEYGIPYRIMSDVGYNFISEKFKSSVISSTSSKQCPHCTTIKAMDK